MVVRWRRLSEPGWQQGLTDQPGRRDRDRDRRDRLRDQQLHPRRLDRDGADPASDPLFSALTGITRTRQASWRPRRRSIPAEIRHTVIVPIAAINRVARQTLAYARSISDNVTAVHVTDDEDGDSRRCARHWNALGTDVPLVIIESPYRSLVGPLLAYIDEIDSSARTIP